MFAVVSRAAGNLEHYQQRLRYILVDEYQDPTSFNISGCAFLAQAPAICAASATTINRFYAGAARMSTISCASNMIFPAPKSSASNQLSLHALTFWPSRRPHRP